MEEYIYSLEMNRMVHLVFRRQYDQCPVYFQADLGEVSLGRQREEELFLLPATVLPRGHPRMRNSRAFRIDHRQLNFVERKNKKYQM